MQYEVIFTYLTLDMKIVNHNFGSSNGKLSKHQNVHLACIPIKTQFQDSLSKSNNNRSPH